MSAVFHEVVRLRDRLNTLATSVETCARLLGYGVERKTVELDLLAIARSAREDAGPAPVRSSDSTKAGSPVVDIVLTELERATSKFPTWPTDPLHALAVLGEEFGELTKAVLQSTYEPHKVTADDVYAEAVQTAAMALRFLASLDRYEYKRGDQHVQGAGREPSRD